MQVCRKKLTKASPKALLFTSPHDSLRELQPDNDLLPHSSTNHQLRKLGSFRAVCDTSALHGQLSNSPLPFDSKPRHEDETSGHQ